MYHIYSTDAIILKRFSVGEANIFVHALTREFGLITASAQGVRLSKSKLNAALSEYSLVTLSSVKGKSGWKIIDATSHTHLYFPTSVAGRQLVARICSTVVTMVSGEEPNPEIYEMILHACKNVAEIEETKVKVIETIVMLRLLYYLGYVVRDTETEKYLLHPTELGETLISEAEKDQPILVARINTAFSASHLI